MTNDTAQVGVATPLNSHRASSQHPYERILHYEIKDHVNSLKLKVNRVMRPSKNRESLIADIVRLSELIKKL